MINGSGSVVFTKQELAAIGIENGELAGLKTEGYVKVAGRRGRPAVAFLSDGVKELLEARKRVRKEAVQAAIKALENG